MAPSPNQTAGAHLPWRLVRFFAGLIPVGHTDGDHRHRRPLSGEQRPAPERLQQNQKSCATIRARGDLVEGTFQRDEIKRPSEMKRARHVVPGASSANWSMNHICSCVGDSGTGSSDVPSRNSKRSLPSAPADLAAFQRRLRRTGKSLRILSVDRCRLCLRLSAFQRALSAADRRSTRTLIRDKT